MKAEQIKNLPMETFLRYEGFNPEKTSDDILWYTSPFRPEASPSFKVDRKKNLWYDFGIGEGGDVISFTMKLKNIPFVKALQYLEPIMVGTEFLASINDSKMTKVKEAKTSTPGIQILSAKPLTGGPLMEYFNSRMITDNTLVSKYCMAVSYHCRERNYFAAGFQNDSGGYELRSKYAKLASTPKDITSIPGTGTHDKCHVFEGFMDFLSFLMIKRGNTDDCLVLNSVAMAAKAVPKLMEYQRVELYLDNDDAGRSMTKYLEDALISTSTVIDRSILYARYKDLNECLCKNINLLTENE